MKVHVVRIKRRLKHIKASHKSLLKLGVVSIFLFFLFYLFGQRFFYLINSTKMKGELSATVDFMGLDCRIKSPELKIPPCSGPYSHYLTNIYHQKGAVAMIARTDELGTVRIVLPAGKYYWMQNEDNSFSQKSRTEFSIASGKVTEAKFIVDTGVR